MSKKFYITTPIYYVNAEPHIGHTYTTIAADCLARYHRMIGDRTFFLTGTDEHGEKNEEIAKNKGVKPQEYVDGVSAKFEMTWDTLNISNDRFIRTTETEHKTAVSNALQQMYDNGFIYKGEYEGLYCRGCEQYKTEKDLIDGKCPDHQKKPEIMKEECYMFKLSKFSGVLRERIESDEFEIRPIEKKKEVLAFLRQGLNDISFSRKNTKWGVPLPWDTDHVAYVWADAFLNYLTGLGWKGEAGKGPDFWPAELQLMSKDILRVHATIWPAMLLALDLPLPKKFFIHGFFLVDGQKMSKSIGNVIAPNELIDKYGVDGTRYLLMSATPFGNDGDIGWKKFDDKYNADLANDLGNLLNRVLAMTDKYFEGIVPAKAEGFLGQTWTQYRKAMDENRIHEALEITWNLISNANQYIEQQQPWQLAKNDDKKELGNTIYVLLETLRHIAWMIYPFLPATAEETFKQLGLEPLKEFKQSFESAWVWGELSPGGKIEKGEALFPKIEEK